MKKRILLALLVIAIVGLSFGCFRSREGDTGPIALTVYGLDDSDVFEPMITEYKDINSVVTIKYKKFTDPTAFENLLVNEIAEGEGPDLFYINNTWLPRHSKKLVPMVSANFTPQNYAETFVNVAANDFIQPDPADGVKKIYSMPLYVDTLALYYNKDIFEQKIPQRGKPATNWEIFKEDAALIRQQSAGGKLERGAIALGRADNIKLSTDILYNLFLQAGSKFYDDEFKSVQLGSQAQTAFDTYLSYAANSEKNFSWNTELVAPNQPMGEVEAFLAGKVASVLGYSDLYNHLETDLKNVAARVGSSIAMKNIAVAPVPQMSAKEADYKAWANYYGLAVSRNSKNPAAAWKFIQFATSKKSAQLYHQKTHRPTARRDLIEDQKKEPIVDVFVSQLGYAGSFRLFSSQKFAEYLTDAVTAANGGQNSREALSQAQAKMNDVMKSEAPNGMYPKPKVVK